jgi:hypothetical protein
VGPNLRDCLIGSSPFAGSPLPLPSGGYEPSPDYPQRTSLFAQKVEARIACKVIDRVTSLGMPVSRKVA